MTVPLLVKLMRQAVRAVCYMSYNVLRNVHKMLYFLVVVEQFWSLPTLTITQEQTYIIVTPYQQQLVVDELQ